VIQIFLIVTVLIAVAFMGLAVGVMVKGKFPDTHVGHNADMNKLGITCAKYDDAYCQGRSDSGGCQGCLIVEHEKYLGNKKK